MGSRVSRSSTAPATAPIVTAKVVFFQDGYVAQFAAHATASDALAAGGVGGDRFVCCSDELRFDAPPRAMAAHDALRPGELYFVLPLSALRQPLSGQDMAALAVKATAALGSSSAVAVAVDDTGGVTSRGKNARGDGKRRPQTTARVAPLLVADEGAGAGHVYGGYDAEKMVRGDRTVRKARIGGGGHIARRRGGLQRLSAILEGSE